MTAVTSAEEDATVQTREVAPLATTVRRVQPLVRALSATTLAALALALSGGVALASTVDDGEWYLDKFEVREFHAQGVDGAGVTIAVIDDAINTQVAALAGADVTVIPESLCADSDGELQQVDTDALHIASHGTNVALKIVGTGQGSGGQDGLTGVAPAASLLFYGFGQDIADDCYEAGSGKPVIVDIPMAAAIVDAVDRGARIISISSGANGQVALEEALAYAVRSDVVVLGATSNDDSDGTSQGPIVSFNGVLGVGSLGDDHSTGLNSDGQPNSSSFIDIVAPGLDVALQGDGGSWDGRRLGSGTSYATPIAAGNLALAMQQTPEATGNQILQLLLHNTDLEAPHEPYYDSNDFILGYGSLDTINLLADDPLQYPDVNPLVAEDGRPTPAEIFGSAAPGPSPSGSAEASPSASSAPVPSAGPTEATVTPVDTATPVNSGAPGWLWPVVVVAIVILGGSAAVIVTIRRNKKASL